jgi:hypothetical protein
VKFCWSCVTNIRVRVLYTKCVDHKRGVSGNCEVLWNKFFINKISKAAKVTSPPVQNRITFFNSRIKVCGKSKVKKLHEVQTKRSNEVVQYRDKIYE